MSRRDIALLAFSILALVPAATAQTPAAKPATAAPAPVAAPAPAAAPAPPAPAAQAPAREAKRPAVRVTPGTGPEADARSCLDLATNIDIHRCAEKYRPHRQA
jgi:hypothetical protein